MENDRDTEEKAILAKVRAALEPLTCDPLWSRDHDRLGFFIHDIKARRGVRFPPVKFGELEEDEQLRQILGRILKTLADKGFRLNQ